MTYALIEDVSQFEAGATIGFAFKEPKSYKDFDGVYRVESVKGKAVVLKNPDEKEVLKKDEILLNGFNWYRIEYTVALDPDENFKIFYKNYEG
ncbi:MAG: hypothetical protein JWN76_1920 [Chitinophagaceae bacterium]|nr:hypothetical protein [Chitinophagaceae bacterium]